jgi:hypothetical protein
MSFTAPAVEETEQSSSGDTLLGFAVERVVAVLTPVLGLFAAWVVPLVEHNIPGVKVTAVQVTSITVAVVVAVLVAGVTWLVGRWKQAPKSIKLAASDLEALYGHVESLVKENPNLQGPPGPAGSTPSDEEISALVEAEIAKALGSSKSVPSSTTPAEVTAPESNLVPQT